MSMQTHDVQAPDGVETIPGAAYTLLKHRYEAADMARTELLAENDRLRAINDALSRCVERLRAKVQSQTDAASQRLQFRDLREVYALPREMRAALVALEETGQRVAVRLFREDEGAEPVGLVIAVLEPAEGAP
jgi:small-conductance mechanosensitive channel